jgi:hypothetical protein
LESLKSGIADRISYYRGLQTDGVVDGRKGKIDDIGRERKN